ncbi:MAG: PEP-CTERM sorting domain-containing protein [Planctomycetota bacterium]
MKKLISSLAIYSLAVTGLLFTSNASADLIIDDFSSGSVSTTTDGFRLRHNNIDGGWQAARQGGGSAWMVSGGTLQNSSTVNTNGYPNYIPGEAPVAQGISLAGLGITPGATEIFVDFDYDVAAGDTLYVTLWGYTGTFDPGTSTIYANLEARYGLSNNEGSSTLDAFNLLDGATTGFGGTTNPFATLTGSGSFSGTIDLTALAIPGVTEVSDLTVISLGFGKMEDGLAGTTSIDNLSLTTIPEPSSIALIGMTVLGIAARRRR